MNSYAKKTKKQTNKKEKGQGEKLRLKEAYSRPATAGDPLACRKKAAEVAPAELRWPTHSPETGQGPTQEWKESSCRRKGHRLCADGEAALELAI